MATTIHIPKQTDRELILALNKIRIALKELHPFRIQVQIPHHQGNTMLPEENPDSYEPIQYAMKEESLVIESFRLMTAKPEQSVLKIERNWAGISDTATIEEGWSSHQGNPEARAKAPQIRVSLLSLIRRELKASDLEASLTGSEDSAWNRYRNAQTKVLSSLEQAAETLLIKNSEKNAELDKARSARFEKLESDLRDQISDERKKLQNDFEAKNADLLDRQKQFAEKEATFNTKEARHVSRKMLDDQLGQVKSWLQDWSLTKGTSQKRTPIFYSYLTAIVFFGAVSAAAIYHNYLVLSRAEDPSALSWWLWAVMLAKTIFPLAAFTTFIVYFIRWSSAWAKQHADEEFHNRTRLIDIGRSSWLLEAVRDAQQSEKEIPADLLKELSRNLFSNVPSGEADMHPQAITDTIMQGLSSIRVRSADGSEVEATRGSKKDK